MLATSRTPRIHGALPDSDVLTAVLGTLNASSGIVHSLANIDAYAVRTRDAPRFHSPAHRANAG